MQWLLCNQTPYDYVRYYTNDEQAVKSLPYKQFMQYVMHFNLKNFEKFIENINKFYTLYIDITNREWQIYQEKEDSTPLNVLIALNPNKATVMDSSRDMREESTQFQCKNFVNTFADFRKKKFFLNRKG